MNSVSASRQLDSVVDRIKELKEVHKKMSERSYSDEDIEFNNQTQKSTTAELEDDDSEDVLKKEELKKKTVSLIAKAVEKNIISKERGKKIVKDFLNQ